MARIDPDLAKRIVSDLNSDKGFNNVFKLTDAAVAAETLSHKQQRQIAVDVSVSVSVASCQTVERSPELPGGHGITRPASWA